MCLEDLRLGKGRRAGRTFSTASPAVPFAVMSANANRVALFISIPGQGTGSLIQFSTDINGTNIFYSALDNQNLPFLFRIEDFGQLITGPIFIVSNTSGAIINVTEITSEVFAPAITDYRQLTVKG